MFNSKLILAALLAGASFAASADRADRRDEHYFWEKSSVAAPAAPVQTVRTVQRAEVGQALQYGARDQRFVIRPSVRSRAEVRAELRAAAQFGLLSGGEADLRYATTEQEAQIAAAGRSAAASGVAALR